MKLTSKITLLVHTSIVIVFLGSVFVQVELQAQEVEDKVKVELFREVETKLEQARTGDVRDLSPTLFAKAKEWHNRADANYKKGERLAKIREHIDKALVALGKANEAAKISRVALTELLKIRPQAAKREFAQLAPNEFRKAEGKYKEAILKAEAGDIRSAKKKADEAIRAYREMIVTALLKGPVKTAEEQIKKARSKLSSQIYKTADRDLKALKKSVQNAKKERFNPAEYVAKIRAQIDGITSVIQSPAKAAIQPNRIIPTKPSDTITRTKPESKIAPAPKQTKVLTDPSQRSFDNLNLMVYPNPFENTVTIELANTVDNKPLIQEAFNALGVKASPNFLEGTHSYTFSTKKYIETETVLLKHYGAQQYSTLAKYLPLLCLHYLLQLPRR